MIIRGRVVHRKKTAIAIYMSVRQKALFLLAALETSSALATVRYLLLLLEDYINKKQPHKNGK